MSADKRTVTTDALETLGTLLGLSEKRDAIHLAVENVSAGMTLRPGDHVNVKDGVAFLAPLGQGLGIVDPFLPMTHINPGQRFWFVMYPRMVHSLRHVWTHPAFPDEVGTPAPAAIPDDAKTKSEQWLRDWIKKADCPDYDTVIKAAMGEYVDNDDYGGPAYSIEDYGDGPSIFFRGRDAHEQIPPEFWDHLEIVTGKKAPVRAVSFSCSC